MTDKRSETNAGEAGYTSVGGGASRRKAKECQRHGERAIERRDSRQHAFSDGLHSRSGGHRIRHDDDSDVCAGNMTQSA